MPKRTNSNDTFFSCKRNIPIIILLYTSSLSHCVDTKARTFLCVCICIAEKNKGTQAQE